MSVNEKDREEAKKVGSLIPPWYWEHDFASEALDEAAIEIARIRSEAYREGFLDGCSKDGTQTERDKAMIAEAIQAERERCVRVAAEWYEREAGYNMLLDEYQQEVRGLKEAILSDDKEPTRV